METLQDWKPTKYISYAAMALKIIAWAERDDGYNGNVATVGIAWHDGSMWEVARYGYYSADGGESNLRTTADALAWIERQGARYSNMRAALQAIESGVMSD